ncbi:MAG: theronine dehydrogenase, partial [Kineothrix sp.]|nr:theronine dehydrogenase [Kineothrix sp.]
MSNVNTIDVEAVVKQVLESMMNGGAASSAGQSSGKISGGQIPKTARVAMLTALEKYEVKEFPIPEVGDGDILV